MDYGEQGRRSSAQHQKGFGEGKTCIDCHKGVAHLLPPIEQMIGAPKEGVVPGKVEVVKPEAAAKPEVAKP
jgi:cytochrome c-type protein NapC